MMAHWGKPAATEPDKLKVPRVRASGEAPLSRFHQKNTVVCPQVCVGTVLWPRPLAGLKCFREVCYVVFSAAANDLELAISVAASTFDIIRGESFAAVVACRVGWCCPKNVKKRTASQEFWT